MATRLGTVITFAEDVTMEEAANIVRDLYQSNKIERDFQTFDTDLGRYRPAGPRDAIHEYESDHGGPVWYIP